MGRIICITGYFERLKGGVPMGGVDFLVSHGVDEDSGQAVVLPNEHPRELGAAYDSDLQEWVIPKPAPAAVLERRRRP